MSNAATGSFSLFAISIVMAGALASTPAAAQTATNYTSTNMWGTASAGVGVPGALESALTHEHNGTIAAQVNAARKDLLIGGTPGLTIYSIGSQSIVSNTVIGNNNGGTTQNTTQTTSNSGAVSNNGQINNP